MRELEELRAKAEELEKLKAKLKKRDQQIASLQEAISWKMVVKRWRWKSHVFLLKCSEWNQ